MRNPRECAKSYQAFRNSDRLRPGIWQSHEERSHFLLFKKQVTTACALGAFLGAEYGHQAIDRGCAESMMPIWLVQATPAIFDCNRYRSTDFRLRWADALFAPGGLVERAGHLDADTRFMVWSHAHSMIIQAFNDAQRCHRRPIVNAPFNVGEWAIGCTTPELREQAAGTIIDCIDEVLTEVGV